MRIISTKDQLAEAIKAGEKVKVVGPLAVEIARKYKKKKLAVKVACLATAAGCLIAAPFTGGTSVIPGVSAAVAGATLTLTTSELLILCGTTVAVYGISKNCKVKIAYEGEKPYLEVDPKN